MQPAANQPNAMMMKQVAISESLEVNAATSPDRSPDKKSLEVRPRNVQYTDGGKN